MSATSSKDYFPKPESFYRHRPSLQRCRAFAAAKGNLMFYSKNVGFQERWARGLSGAAMVACGLVGLGFTPLGLLVACAGVVTVVTGLVGFCPACAMVGRKLHQSSRR
jgi:hypothetical protein